MVVRPAGPSRVLGGERRGLAENPLAEPGRCAERAGRGWEPLGVSIEELLKQTEGSTVILSDPSCGGEHFPRAGEGLPSPGWASIAPVPLGVLLGPGAAGAVGSGLGHPVQAVRPCCRPQP